MAEKEWRADRRGESGHGDVRMESAGGDAARKLASQAAAVGGEWRVQVRIGSGVAVAEVLHRGKHRLALGGEPR
jgi:hypothetical protein